MIGCHPQVTGPSEVYDDAISRLVIKDQLRQVVELVLEFQDVFVGLDRKVYFTDWVKHEISMEDGTPVKCVYLWKSFS